MSEWIHLAKYCECERAALLAKLDAAAQVLEESLEQVCEHPGAIEFLKVNGGRFWCSPCSNYVRSMEDAEFLGRAKKILADIRGEK